MYNILVVDDDKEIVESIEIYLRNEGYKVFKAYDGLEALDILTNEEIHLILMDIMMPKLDGIKATIKIRQSHAPSYFYAYSFQPAAVSSAEGSSIVMPNSSVTTSSSTVSSGAVEMNSVMYASSPSPAIRAGMLMMSPSLSYGSLME